MVTLLTIVHVVACIFLILTVLLQAGKGGGVGVALGGSTSAQVFGGRGAGSFLERLTSGTAIVFMLTSMSLAYIASKSDSARLQKIAADQAAKKKAADVKAADDKAAKDAEDRNKNGAPPTGEQNADEPGDAPAEKAAPVEKAAEKPAEKAAEKKEAAPKTDAAPKKSQAQKALDADKASESEKTE